MEINSLKELDKGELLDIFYPIGSYYETSNTSFNPNVSFGGTWVRDTDGLVTIGAVDKVDSTNTTKVQVEVGMTIGEKEHTLTINEIPNHNHEILPRGRKMYWDSGLTGMLTSSNWGNEVQVSSKNTYTAKVGGGVSHNNIQPSIGVYRWHRTA